MTTLAKCLMRQACLRAQKSGVLFATLLCLILQTAPLHATVSTVAYWRIGEDDTPIPTFGGSIFTNLTDVTGNFPLTVQGTVAYSTNVSAAASSATESTVCGDFINAYATNNIVSAATNNFGIECWVKPTVLGGVQVIAYNGSTGGIGYGGWGIILGADNNYYGLFGGVTTLGGVPATSNVWTHLALVRASGVATLYVNGVAAGITTAVPPGVPTAGGFALGAPPQSPTNQLFTGYLDEVRVFTFATNQFSTSDLLLNWTAYVDTTDRLEGPGAASDTVFLGTPSSFIAWTNTANAAWLHLAAPQQSGTNSGYIPFSFDANPGATRTGTLTIAGQTVNITQAGAAYTPATQIGVLFNSFTPAGLAVDPAGTVYSTSGNAVFTWSPGDSIPSPLITSGLSGPQGLAFDYENNLLIANGGISAISKWIAASNTLITLGSTPSLAASYLTVDFAGNVYFNTGGSDNNGSPYKWSPFTGAVTRLNSLTEAVGPFFYGIASDGIGDVYWGYVGIAGKTGTTVAGILGQLVNGTIVYYDAPLTNPPRHPRGVALDGESYIYEGEATANQLKEIVLPSGGVSVVATNVAPLQIAVDRKRNLYYSDSSITGVKERPYAFVDASAILVSADSGSGQLPAVLPVSANLTGAFYPTTDQSWLSITGVTNGVIYFSYQVNTNAARTGDILVLGQSISVQQQGASYSVGTTNLLIAPGVGKGSVVLFDTPQISTWTASADVSWLQLAQTNGAGNTNIIFTYEQNPDSTRVGTVTIAGQTITVTQAGVNDVPASAVVPLTASLSNSPCVAVDGAGNVYFTDTNGFIDYWSPTNQTTTVLVSNLVDAPASLALDPMTNIYFSDPSNHSILEWSAANGTVSTVLSNAATIPLGLAIDAAGDICFFDAGDNAVEKWSAVNNELYVIVTNVPGTTGIALDAAQNLYLANGPGNTVWEWNSVSGALLPLIGGLSNPQGVAVDGSGNVYVADSQNNAIREWSAADDTTNKLVFPGLNNPAGIAVDQAQNLYVADSGNGLIKELPYAMIDSSGVQLPLGAGSNALPAVLPPGANLGGIFAPTVDQAWLTITGVTNGVVSFSFTANNTGTNRIANIDVLGQDVLILQGQTTNRLGIDHRLEGPAAGADSVLVAVTPDAGTWTATANATWLHLATYSQSGNGSGLVVFNFDSNPGTTRTGTLTIGGQTFTVIQAGANYVQAGSLTTVPVPVVYPTDPVNNQVLGIATDTNGNVYYNENNTGYVWRWSPSNQTATLCAGLIELFNYLGMSSSDNGILCTADWLQGEEEFYIGFGGTNATLETSGITAIISGLIPPPLPPGILSVRSAVADDAGNFYFTSSDTQVGNIGPIGNGVVVKVTITNVAYGAFPTNSGYSILSSNYAPLGGIARDRAGNIYFGNGLQAVKWSAKSKTTAYIPLHATIGPMVVDGAGDVYAAAPGYGGPGLVAKLTAATGAQTIPVANGLDQLSGVAVDDQRNIFVGDYSPKAFKMLPYVFVDPTPVTVSGNAGGGSLPQVLPASAYLFPPFAPGSDQPWLTITGTNNGIVSFAVTANTTGSNRVAHISLLNQSIAVTQSILITPPVLTGPTSSNGTFGFMFTNNQTTNFSVLYSTNVATPLSNWILLGAPSNISPGLFQFTDPGATNSPQGFYRVSSP